MKLKTAQSEQEGRTITPLELGEAVILKIIRPAQTASQISIKFGQSIIKYSRIFSWLKNGLETTVPKLGWIMFVYSITN